LPAVSTILKEVPVNGLRGCRERTGAPTRSPRPEAKQMTLKTVTFPNESIRCQRGDYILQRGASGRIRVYRVDDLVKLSRLVPFGEDALIEEQAILYLVVLGSGSLSMVSTIAGQSFVPSLVNSKQLGEANSQLQATTSAASILGPGLGGFRACEASARRERPRRRLNNSSGGAVVVPAGAVLADPCRARRPWAVAKVAAQLSFAAEATHSLWEGSLSC
jgi:hypothetical protein